MKSTKKLSFWEILSTIAISYLSVSYFNADFDPFHWDSHVRFMQVVTTAVSFGIQYAVKNDKM